MTEGSVYWEGSITGDAAGSFFNAPYTAVEASDILALMHQNDSVRGFVLPNYLNNLKVQANSPAALNVIVKSGGAICRGRIYKSDADTTLTIGTADATNPRLDRIVLRVSFASQTIRLAVLAGTAAATPALPSLTQNTTTYEYSLGYVWVAATATTIADTEVHDERAFAPNLETLFNALFQGNLIANSEFMAISSVGATTTPDRWADSGVANAPTLSLVTKPAQMARGRAVRMTAGAASRGISQTFFCKASTMYAVRALIQVTAGDVGRFYVNTNSASTVTIDRIIRRTGSYIEHIIYYMTESDATRMTVSIECVNNTDIVDVGQVLAVEGYVTGPFRECHETIIYERPLTDAAWTATAKSTSAGSVVLTTNFQSTIMAGTKAAIVKFEANDSGSAASTAEFAIQDTDGTVSDASRIYLRGVPNDIKRADQCIISLVLMELSSTPSVGYDIVASGASTLDATIQIHGIII